MPLLLPFLLLFTQGCYDMTEMNAATHLGFQSPTMLKKQVSWWRTTTQQNCQCRTATGQVIS